jgi:hypothetical protein
MRRHTRHRTRGYGYYTTSDVSLHLLEKGGGKLSVWSEPGAGALFVAEFPRRSPT